MSKPHRIPTAGGTEVVDPGDGTESYVTAPSASEETRTNGPELGGQTRLDIVEEVEGLFRLDVMNVAGSRAISEPMAPRDMRRLIMRPSGALRRATRHLRDHEAERENLRKYLAEIEDDYAKPDYPRELLQQEVAELRAEVRALRGETVH